MKQIKAHLPGGCAFMKTNNLKSYLKSIFCCLNRGINLLRHGGRKAIR